METEEGGSESGQRGLIFNIQSYSVQDGPGVRTTVFMKGCPLKCKWCHNPESIRPYPELITHNMNCAACGKCARACPVRAITVDPIKGREIDFDKCNLCFACVGVCPRHALEKVGMQVTVEQVVAEIEKYEVFYRHSEGGVTVSGGEPLLQAAFVRQLLQSCKERHWHTTLDTSGYAPWPALEEALEFTDLVLYDVKHLDPRLHEEGTGVDNRLILENLRRISNGPEIWLRVPLIASYNDSCEHVGEVVKLALKVKAKGVSALLYHRSGVGKYNGLGLPYSLENAEPPGADHLQELQRMGRRMGMELTVGH